MALKDELEGFVDSVFTDSWETRNGQKVPEADEVGHGNKAVKLDATVLYADLAGSTKMTEEKRDWVAASIYKSYLYCAAKIIRANGGEITAYDGDRVMAVFIGGSKNTNAVKSGLQIHWAVTQVVMPRYKQRFPETTYTLKQRVGIATSPLYIARTGIRGNNDLVWVGNAANHAAKMAALDPVYPTYITTEVYWGMNEKVRMSTSQPDKDMWTDLGDSDLGYDIYGSTWWRAPGGS